MKYWSSVLKDKTCQKIFTTAPIVAFCKHTNIGDIIISSILQVGLLMNCLLAKGPTSHMLADISIVTSQLNDPSNGCVIVTSQENDVKKSTWRATCHGFGERPIDGALCFQTCIKIHNTIETLCIQNINRISIVLNHRMYILENAIGCHTFVAF